MVQDVDASGIDFAPWLAVSSSDRVVNIEHPGIVKNIDRGILSLGGETEIRKFLRSTEFKRSIGFRVTPEDGFRKQIPSWPVKTSDILLKISVPRRTGRRRKRGSSGPFFAFEEDGLQNAQDILSRLRDNAQAYTVSPVGFIEETHRFRAIPDFQWSLATSPLANSIRESILPFEYEKLKDFKMDLKTTGSQLGMDMIPPPTFAQSSISFNYAYHQNPHVKLSLSKTDATPSFHNIYVAAAPTRTVINSDTPTIPLAASPTLPAITTLEPHMQDLIADVLGLLTERPIISRRALLNAIPRDAEYDLKLALPYVGYAFSTGPWRDAVVRFGYDPRTQPEGHKYQTLVFKLILPVPPPSASNPTASAFSSANNTGWVDSRVRYSRQVAARDTALQTGDRQTTHIFDGVRLVADGKVWQICDMTDPVIAAIVAQPDAVRATCDVRGDGWLANGTLGKIRTIMRDKIGLLGKGIVPDQADYERVKTWPNVLTEENVGLTLAEKGVDGGGWTVKETRLATLFRALVGKLPGGNGWKGRRAGKSGGRREDEEDVEVGNVIDPTLGVEGDVEDGGDGDGDEEVGEGEDERDKEGDDEQEEDSLFVT